MSTPLIYAPEDQLKAAYENFGTSTKKEDTLIASAFRLDEGEVFHLYPSLPKIHISGLLCSAAVRFVESLGSEDAVLAIARDIHSCFFENDAVGVIAIVGAKASQLYDRAFVINHGQLQPAVLKYILQQSDLYSRSKGLLETSILRTRKVGIVGLGSGGSSVAVELTKAGVGQFTLIDYDRLELSNISRHACGLGDLGRYKTKAVRDLLFGKNPYVEVKTYEVDINQNIDQTIEYVSDCDLIIAATDNNRSRFNLNDIALQYKIPIIFGRALTRAVGGDVLRVRPYETPCLACIFTSHFLESREEEVSRFEQARAASPAYVSDTDAAAIVQVGLSSDIMPIANMVVKLALVELSRGLKSGIASLEEDLVAPFYIWANRREKAYSSWPLMKYETRTPSILRWYGAKCERNVTCPACGSTSEDIVGEENIFSS